MTLRGALPSTLNDASSSGSTERCARPLARTALPEPGIRSISATGVEDGDIGMRRSVIDAACEAVSNIAVAVPRPRGKPLRQHIRRRRDRDHDDIGIGLA